MGIKEFELLAQAERDSRLVNLVVMFSLEPLDQICMCKARVVLFMPANSSPFRLCHAPASLFRLFRACRVGSELYRLRFGQCIKII